MGPQIGVEIRGIDVKTMDDDTWNRIYQAWLDHNVMCVRGQDLTIPDFIRYSERFGPVTPHPSKSTRHPEHPKITMLGINKFDAEGKLRDEIYRRGAEGWHADGDELIAELTQRMITPDAEYHHKWEKGDIVIWDNRCSYHRAAGDYPPEEDRIHWRVSINDYGIEVAEAAE